MRIKFVLISLILMIIILFSFSFGCVIYEKPSLNGQPAPNFTLNQYNGSKVTLSDLKGKAVLLDFATVWNTPVKEQFIFLDLYKKRYEQKDLVRVYLIIVSAKESDIKSYLDNLNKENTKTYVPILYSPDLDIVFKYKVFTYPTIVVIGQDGIVRFTHIGFNIDEMDVISNELKDLVE